MLQVARLAAMVLGDSAPRITAFLEEQWNDDGGARDRAGESDLYYTVFALEGLMALQADIPSERTRAYLERFGAGGELDMVHVACLARCWASLPGGATATPRAEEIGRNLERFRSRDGGYGGEPGLERGTVYHGFLALGAHQDLGGEAPDGPALASSIASLASSDGAYSNLPDAAEGGTAATAAAVAVLRQLGADVPDGVAPWLLSRAHDQGGFLAAPRAPMPDLLSTATALHALSILGADISGVAEPCLDFVDTLWTGRGFCGHWADDVVDSEYAYYALLALGHAGL